MIGLLARASCRSSSLRSQPFLAARRPASYFTTSSFRRGNSHHDREHHDSNNNHHDAEIESKGLSEENKKRLWIIGSVSIFGPLFYKLTEKSNEKDRKREKVQIRVPATSTEPAPLSEKSIINELSTPTSVPDVNTEISVSTESDEVVSSEYNSQKTEFVMEPPTSESPKVQFVLIGAGTAAFSALQAIKQTDPNAQVVMIGDEPFQPYMRPPLSKELWFGESNTEYNNWNGEQKSIFHQPQDAYDIVHPSQLLSINDTKKPKFVQNYRVESINVDKQYVVLSNGQKIEYGKLLLATGGSPKSLPFILNLSREEQEHFSTFRTLSDFSTLKELANQDKTIAIIGGGFLGSELSCALARNSSSKVIQIFPEEGNMALIFPKYLTHWTTAKLRKSGVDVIPSSKIASAQLTTENKISLEFENGKSVNVDHVVSAIGITPNTLIAKEAGLEIDDIRGGVIVNAELEARKNIFVAGDLSSFHDIALGRRRVEHYDHAVMSGKQAGLNMVGEAKPYTHQSMFWSDLGPEIGYEAIGIVDSKLKTVGVWANGTGRKESNDPSEEFNKGVVFYLNAEERIVGVLLWNHFGKIDIARKLIKEGKSYKDVNQLITLFNVHSS